jgi:hypothetical protein
VSPWTIVRLEVSDKLKIKYNGLIRSGTLDLPTSGIVPQPITLLYILIFIFIKGL